MLHLPATGPLRRSAVATMLGFAALLAVAGAVRWWIAGETHLWFDELYTLRVARQPLPDLLRIVAADIHPPLHFLLVAAWRAIGGEGDLWIKSLSVLTGLAGVALLVPAGRDLFSRPAGWVAAALLALHPAHAAFSQESRAFALLFLLFTLATWTAWRWIEHERPADAVVYGLTAAAALWTHYLAAVVLAFLMAWGIVALRHDRRRLGSWLGLHLAAALLFGPQVPTLLVQAQRLRADSWVKPASLATLGNFVRQLALGPVYLAPPLLVLAALPLARSSQRRAASLLWCTSLLPVAVLWALSMARAGLFLERYMFFALPAFALLVAAGITGLRSRPAAVALTLALLAFAARGLQLHPRQPEAVALERAERWLAPRIRSGDLVVHADAHSVLYARAHPEDSGRHVLLVTTPTLPYYEGEQVIPADWRITPAQFARDTAGGRRWWGMHEVYGFPGAEAATGLLRRAARGDSIQIDRVHLWAGTAAQSVR